MTNIAIMAVLSITLRLLGVDSILAENGSDLNIQALVILSGVIGFGGSIISLLISKWMTSAVVITQPKTKMEKGLMSIVEKQAQIVGIKMPEVAIFPTVAMNAFATGANKNNALMAVSQGLLDNMTPGEIEAVVGHEMSHIANGDMVTLALIQGVERNKKALEWLKKNEFEVLWRMALAGDGDEDSLTWLLLKHRDFAHLAIKIKKVKDGIQDDNDDPHRISRV